MAAVQSRRRGCAPYTDNGHRLTKQGGAGRFFFLRSVNLLGNNGATTI